MTFQLTSNYAHIQFWFFYIGWNNHHRYVASEMDCGDETFGIGIGNLYAGCYSDGKWVCGFLNEYGCLE
jgi:hypothetical protein